MKSKKILCAALAVVALSTVSVWKTYAAPTNIPMGTVVIGNKAFDLAYANASKNQAEITAAIVAGGGIYIKNFSSVWINNITGNAISASSVPAVTYKNSTGAVTSYTAGDNSSVAVEDLEVISIE